MKFNDWWREERRCGHKPGPEAIWNAALRLGGAQPLQTTNSRYVTALHVYLQWCAEVRLDTVNNLLSYHTWLNERINAEKDPHCT